VQAFAFHSFVFRQSLIEIGSPAARDESAQKSMFFGNLDIFKNRLPFSKLYII